MQRIEGVPKGCEYRNTKYSEITVSYRYEGNGEESRKPKSTAEREVKNFRYRGCPTVPWLLVW